MGFDCGIVGLPNVGKSTIFNALTNAGAACANYPFCTIDPNKGVVAVPDERLQRIASIIKPAKVVPTNLEFVDIAGLVQGASKGQGLGNQFLGHIRGVAATCHVLRCFEDPDVVHVSGRVDPVHDMEIIHTELILADLEVLNRSVEKTRKLLKGPDKEAPRQHEVLTKVQKGLEEGRLARNLGLTAEEQALIHDAFLITLKPMFLVCNVDESGLKKEPTSVQEVRGLASREHMPIVTLCGKIEAELSELTAAEKKSFLQDYGLECSGLERMARVGYDLLGLITFFTAGPKEVRAWTVKRGTLAPQAAGVIHSDFERGFIKAEVCHYDDLIHYGSMARVKEAGQYRMEGKEYVVKDGDVMLFKFNV